MSAILHRFFKDESGATAIEYGLIASLIALALIIGAGQLGTQINATFVAIKDKLAGSSPKP